MINYIFYKLQPLFVAIQFLTIIPLPLSKQQPKPESIGNSLAYYPLVGLLIGILLGFIASVLSHALDSLLVAALLLTIWIMLTGALHLDGLADCADAWMGGLGSKNRTLLILKDPTSGPMAIVAIFSVLLIKFTAIYQLLLLQQFYLFVIPPILARIAAMMLFATTPYVREQGLGRVISDHLPKKLLWVVFLLALMVAMVILKKFIVMLLICCFLSFIIFRYYIIRRLGGCTGDTAGALIELVEVVVLLTCIAWVV